jgi:GNAT superfamily N-acetyltransferase
MSDQPTDLAAAESAAVEDNHRASFRLAAQRFDGALVREDAESFWVITGGMHPMLNVVVSTRWSSDLSLEQIREKIAATLAPFQLRRLPLLWYIWPSTQPADLGAHLRASGLMLADTSPGMVRDLTQPLPTMAPVAGLQIELVRDDDTYEHWMTTGLQAFAFGDHDQEVLRPFFRKLGYAAPLFQYAGSLHGTMIGTATRLMADGIAGIYNVGTLPEARRKGIGAAMTLAALTQARARGYQRAILAASEMGYPVYEQLGFRTVCSVTQYAWMPGGATANAPAAGGSM